MLRTKEGLEVDFLARHIQGGEELIQVCAKPDSPETIQRELAGLSQAAMEHPQARRSLVTLTPESIRRLPRDIEVRWEPDWLLSTS